MAKQVRKQYFRKIFYMSSIILVVACSSGGDDGAYNPTNTSNPGISSVSSSSSETQKPNSSASVSSSIATSVPASSNASSDVSTSSSSQTVVSSQSSESSQNVTVSSSSLSSSSSEPSAGQIGKDIYDQHCATCHNGGVAGAPTLDEDNEWETRLGTKGIEVLYQNAINGYNGMPAKGACSSCDDVDIIAAVNHMLGTSLSADLTSLISITTDGVFLNYSIPVDPVYPRRALSRGIEGYVVLIHDVDTDGIPNNIRVLNSSPRVFGGSAIRALERSIVDVNSAEDLIDVTTVFTFRISESTQ